MIPGKANSPFCKQSLKPRLTFPHIVRQKEKVSIKGLAHERDLSKLASSAGWMLHSTELSVDLGKNQQREHMVYFISSSPFTNLAVVPYLWNRSDATCAVPLLSYGRKSIGQVIQTLFQGNRKRRHELQTFN